MRLWTFQTLEVLGTLAKDKTYFPSWDKCSWKEERGFLDAYAWLMEQYNLRKKQEFSCPPVFWYTNIKDVKRLLNERQDNRILISADVPDKFILLHEFNDWHNVLNNCGLGMYSSEVYNNWDLFSDDLMNEKFDKVYDIYKRHSPSKEESWKEIFHLPKKDRWKQDIHAITPFIYDIWLEPNEKSKTEQFGMT